MIILLSSLPGLVFYAGCDSTQAAKSIEAGSRSLLQRRDGTKEVLGVQLCCRFALAQVQGIHWQPAVTASS